MVRDGARCTLPLCTAFGCHSAASEPRSGGGVHEEQGVYPMAVVELHLQHATPIGRAQHARPRAHTSNAQRHLSLGMMQHGSTDHAARRSLRGVRCEKPAGARCTGLLGAPTDGRGLNACASAGGVHGQAGGKRTRRGMRGVAQRYTYVSDLLRVPVRAFGPLRARARDGVAEVARKLLDVLLRRAARVDLGVRAAVTRAHRPSVRARGLPVQRRRLCREERSSRAAQRVQ
jgi:hypothetical protein